ncbi:hypothetical protein GLYMA_07G137550v4 [Glycine max]|nr:hypothetical protein GLYMA_07G137550v4 [Glycine max]KAH1086767.1 hypothetical protein GYH30_018326 [Glycine max]
MKLMIPLQVIIMELMIPQVSSCSHDATGHHGTRETVGHHGDVDFSGGGGDFSGGGGF